MPLATKEKQLAYQSAWLKKRRDEWVASKGGLCSKCGSGDRVVVVIPDSTRHSVWSWKAEKRAEMLRNAFLLCFRCNNARAVAKRPKKAPKHGTENTYGKHRCRCEPCRAAKAAAEARRYLRDHPVRLRRPGQRRTLPELQQVLLGQLLRRLEVLKRREKLSREVVQRVLIARGHIEAPPPPPTTPPPPTLRQVVAKLEECPMVKDPIWNVLAAPMWYALLATPAGMTPHELIAVGKKAGLTFGLSSEALAWMHWERLATWQAGRWCAT